MDCNCTMQGTDYNPNYDSLLLQGITITKSIEQYCEDQDYEFLELGVQSSDGVQEGTVNFDSKVEAVGIVPSSVTDYDTYDSSVDVDLETFLRRPVKIASYVWSDNLEFDQTFAPWYEYFNNTAVKKKLDNYSFLRCDLHIKFMLNASPFYYGSLLASYRPLANLDTGAFFEPCEIVDVIGTTHGAMTALSQRPHVILDACGCVGGQLKLPFFYPKDWLRISVANDFYDMGTINLRSMRMILQNANGIVGTGCNIQVYAWADNVKLAGPTVALSMQSSDEYGQGIISKPASAVARFAAQLQDWPVIGPYATATSLAANTIANIAAMFGYTDVPVIDDVHAFMPKSAPNFASTDIGIAIEKLTLDSKNELSIDPKSVGIDTGDELCIGSIVSRETYIDTFTWTSADATDTLLYNVKVSPEIINIGTNGGTTYVNGSPSWMVASMFKYWRGDMKYRFKIVSSAFHRGRLLFSWDPYGSISSTTNTSNLVFTKIVDITEESDFVINIPFTQTTRFLKCEGSNTINHGTAPLTNLEGYTNGVLTVRVLNEQTSSNADADIAIIIFGYADVNMEFADPIPNNAFTNELSLYNKQSKDDVDTSIHNDQMARKGTKDMNNTDLIYMGECVKSLRQILRRTTLTREFLYTTHSSTSMNTYVSVFNRMPLYYGWDPQGINSAISSIPSTLPFNFVQNIPINWVGACFIANKGAVHWNINIDSATANRFAQTVRRGNTTLNSSGYWAHSAIALANNSTVPRGSILNYDNMFGGSIVADGDQQKCINFSVPFYNNLKFVSNNPNYRTEGSTVDNTEQDSAIWNLSRNIATASSTSDIDQKMYCSIGTDFNFLFFLNVPTYRYIDFPDAV